MKPGVVQEVRRGPGMANRVQRPESARILLSRKKAEPQLSSDC